MLINPSPNSETEIWRKKKYWVKKCDKIVEKLLIVFVLEVAIQHKQWETKAGAECDSGTVQ